MGRVYMDWSEARERVPVEVVHASMGRDNKTLCGQTDLPNGGVVLDLNHPDARRFHSAVTCKVCVEWMHA